MGPPGCHPVRIQGAQQLSHVAFVALHLFYAGRRNLSDVAEILCIIERLEDIHTEVQGMISSLQLASILLYDVLQRCIQYLNRCVATLASEVVKAPGARVPFSLDPIMVNLQGVYYVGPTLPGPLVDLLAGQYLACSSSSSGYPSGNSVSFGTIRI